MAVRVVHRIANAIQLRKREGRVRREQSRAEQTVHAMRINEMNTKTVE
jgi:hypothetical protein